MPPTNKLSYRGNASLKKPGASFDWTPELAEELRRCKNDVIYFAEHYFKIVTENGLELIQLRDYQKEMLRSMVNNRRTISNQSRQSGKSETFRIFLTWYIIFNDYKTVAILANKGETSREILSKLQISYQNLPAWLQLGVKDFNKGSFTLENDSRIIATSTSKNSARGFTAHVVVLDEMAFIENFEEFYSAVYPIISAGKLTKLIITSTPNGLNHFYDFWQGALKKKNGFHPIYVPWDRVPGRDEAWKEDTLKGMNNNVEKFNTEFGCEFVGSSGTLIAGWALNRLKNNIEEPILREDSLSLYKYPIKEIKEWKGNKEITHPAHKYVVLADVSRGKGLDYSAFSVFDITKMPYKQVCVYRNNEVTPRDYAEVIHRVSKAYNDALIMVEINDIGEQVSDILINDLENESVLCTETMGRNGKNILFSGTKADKGIRTTPGVKLSGCLLLKLMIEQDQIEIHDENTVMELITFIKVKKTYQAEPNKHDDIAMGLVLFSWFTNQQFFKDLTEISTINQLRERTSDQIKAIMPWYTDPIPQKVEYEFFPTSYNLNQPFHPYLNPGDEILIVPNF